MQACRSCIFGADTVPRDSHGRTLTACRYDSQFAISCISAKIGYYAPLASHLSH
jgi:hypothetical protein